MKRIIYLDYMRLVATFAIIILHIVAGSLTMVELLGMDWHILNIFESVVRWGVPVFFMISGALFLGRDVKLKDIYGKYILRMITAFVFWSFVYSLVQNIGSGSVSIASLIEGSISGYYHMWFILIIIGIYVCIPFLKKITEDEQLTKYFLLVFIVMQVILPAAINAVEGLERLTNLSATVRETSADDLIGVLCEFIRIINILLQNIINTKPYTAMGYAGYFVLGYYLENNVIDKVGRMWIYILGLVGALSTIIATYLASKQNGANVDTWYGYFMPGVFLMSLAVFVWFKYNVAATTGVCENKSSRVTNVVTVISNLCFGVYLVHVLVIEQLYYKLGISPFAFGNLPLGVLIVGIIVFAISLFVSWLLHFIPILNKYVV